MSRRRRIVAALLVALPLAVLPSPAAAAPPDPAPLLLRLADLGPGYVVFDKGFSGIDRRCFALPIDSEPASPALRAIGRAHPNRGCVMSFQRAWTAPEAAPGPGYVASAAFAFNDADGPRAALARPRDVGSLVAALSGPIPHSRVRLVEPVPQIGDEAVLLRYRERFRHRVETLALLVWRSGNVLAGIEAATVRRKPSDADERNALALAAAEQARIVTPTPLAHGDYDDRLVPLDDPALAGRVMWLGETLPSRNGFPTLRLRKTDDDCCGFVRRAPLARMVYESYGLPEAATAELWRPAPIRRLLRGRPDHDLCERRFDGGLASGDSMIFTMSLRRGGRCPRRAVTYFAVALFPRIGVTIDASGCCRSVEDPYASIAGVRRLLRALRPREPSASAPARPAPSAAASAPTAARAASSGRA